MHLHRAGAVANSHLSRMQEVSILKSLNYDKNITQFYGACIRPGEDLMLVTEVWVTTWSDLGKSVRVTTGSGHCGTDRVSTEELFRPTHDAVSGWICEPMVKSKSGISGGLLFQTVTQCWPSLGARGEPIPSESGPAAQLYPVAPGVCKPACTHDTSDLWMRACVSARHCNDQSDASDAFRVKFQNPPSLKSARNHPQLYFSMRRAIQHVTSVVQYMAGGDLRDALDKDKRTELVWYRKGYQIALDIARGLHFLHSHDVR